MKWPPTDLELLEEIYKRYYSVFAGHSREEPTRSTKMFVPINIRELADHFNVDADIVFGRLYYDLEPKYGFENSDGTKVPFFYLKTGDDTNVVHFPLLASVVAKLRDERKKHLIATWISISALVISSVSAGFSVNKKPEISQRNEGITMDWFFSITSTYNFTNIEGLFLELLGFVLLWKYGLPVRIRGEGILQLDNRDSPKAKKYKALSHLGFFLIICGVIVQIFSNVMK